MFDSIVNDQPTNDRARLVRAGAHGIGVPQAGILVAGVQIPPGEGYELRVDDGSGAAAILLDEDVAFTLTGLVPDAQIDAIGVLVPAGVGTWKLKPRRNADVVIR